MHLSHCKCFHHKLQKVLMVLGWVSAIGFWVATWQKGSLFGISSLHYFKEVIVFALLGIGLHRGCACCCGGCAGCSTEGRT